MIGNFCTNSRSAPVSFQNLGTIYVKLVKVSARQEILVRVDIVMDGSTIIIVMNLDTTWPFKIVNQSSVDVVLFQECSHAKYKINKGLTMYYCWDEPSVLEKALVLQVNGVKQSINIQEIGPVLPCKDFFKE